MCVLPRATPDNFAAANVFGDGLKRALRESWREQLGASYDVRGGVETLPGGTAVLDLAADVDHALLAPALRELRRLLVPSTPLPAEGELESARRGTANRFRIESATSGLMAMDILEMWMQRWPIETLDKLPGQARAVGAADLTRIADHCRANVVIGMLGDENKLRAAWAQSEAK